MPADPARPRAPRAAHVLTRERLLGTAERWRRLGVPVAAGDSTRPDGSVDHGVFGPGSIAWQILLHPATIVFQFTFQQRLQLLYRPIVAGLRDADPVAMKARRGTLTAFDVFERGQRNCGIHAPMWLGDTATATRVADHLRSIHARVAGDVIDVGEPELGGYAANSPREAMWAALTEMHSMLWLYESFAFRDGRPPHRLTDAERDRFVGEMAAYCRLFPHDESELPSTFAELEALYERHEALFRPSETSWHDPETGVDVRRLHIESIERTMHHSQEWALRPIRTLYLRYDDAVVGAFPSWLRRRAMGLDVEQEAAATAALRGRLGAIKRMQGPASERRYLELMWGPDATELIASARRAQARRTATEVAS